MYNFSKYKEQYRANLLLAFPVILSQLGQVVVQLADNIMVGQYGGDNPDPLAAASFGGSVFFLTYIACMALTFGITPIVGELFAQNKMEKAGRVLHNSVVLFPIIGVVAMLVQFSIVPLMHFMGQPEHIVEMAIPYYKTLVWSMVPIMVFFTFKQFLEGVGNTSVAMYIVVACNVINVALNYVLINGVMGFPELGALGAGLATLFSRVMQALAIVVFFVVAPKFKHYITEFAMNNISRKKLRKIMKVSVPISSQVFLESSVFVITSIVVGVFGETVIGGNQIGMSMGNCAFMIALSIGSASTIRVSHCYGAKSFEEMSLASSAAWHLAVAWTTVTALVFILFRNVLPLLFTTNAEMIEIASTLLIFIGIYQIPDGIQCIAVGILRGMQDVKIITPIALFSYWILNFPIGYFCAFNLGMGPKGLYIGFIVGLSMAALLMYLRIRKRQKALSAKK